MYATEHSRRNAAAQDKQANEKFIKKNKHPMLCCPVCRGWRQRQKQRRALLLGWFRRCKNCIMLLYFRHNPPGSSIISHAKHMTDHILQKYMLNSTIDPFMVPAQHCQSSKCLFPLHLFRGSHATHEKNNDVRTKYDDMTRFRA